MNSLSEACNQIPNSISHPFSTFDSSNKKQSELHWGCQILVLTASVALAALAYYAISLQVAIAVLVTGGLVVSWVARKVLPEAAFVEVELGSGRVRRGSSGQESSSESESDWEERKGMIHFEEVWRNGHFDQVESLVLEELKKEKIDPSDRGWLCLYLTLAYFKKGKDQPKVTAH